MVHIEGSFAVPGTPPGRVGQTDAPRRTGRIMHGGRRSQQHQSSAESVRPSRRYWSSVGGPPINTGHPDGFACNQISSAACSSWRPPGCLAGWPSPVSWPGARSRLPRSLRWRRPSLPRPCRRRRPWQIGSSLRAPPLPPPLPPRPRPSTYPYRQRRSKKPLLGSSRLSSRFRQARLAARGSSFVPTRC